MGKTLPLWPFKLADRHTSLYYLNVLAIIHKKTSYEAQEVVKLYHETKT